MASPRSSQPVPTVASDRRARSACLAYAASYALLFLLGIIAIAWVAIGHVDPSRNDTAAGLILGGLALMVVVITGSYLWYYLASVKAALCVPAGDPKADLPRIVASTTPLGEEEFYRSARVRTLSGRAGKCRVELYSKGIRIWRGPSHAEPSWTFDYGDLIQAEVVTLIGASAQGPVTAYLRLIAAQPRMAFLISSGSSSIELMSRLGRHGVPMFASAIGT